MKDRLFGSPQRDDALVRAGLNHFTRSPEFTKVKLVAAIALSTVDKLDPGEIIQMALLARNEETGRHDGRRLALPLTVPMHIAAAVPPVKVEPQLEESGLERHQELAMGTDLPAGKRGHRHADIRRLIERAGGDPGGLARHRRVSSFATCDSSSCWTARNNRGSPISVTPCSMDQSSNPMTITERLGSSTIEPNP